MQTFMKALLKILKEIYPYVLAGLFFLFIVCFVVISISFVNFILWGGISSWLGTPHLNMADALAYSIAGGLSTLLIGWGMKTVLDKLL